MRRKPVLSHSPLLFPTIPAIVVSVLLPAFFSEARAQAQTSSSFEEELTRNKKKNAEVRKDEKKPETKPETKLVDDKDAPVIVKSYKFWGRSDRFIHFEHDVDVNKGALNLRSDKASYRFLEDEVEASGNVRVEKNGDCYYGDNATVQLDSGAGRIDNPVYKLLRSNAQGHARRIDLIDDERSLIHEGTYSTCEGLNPDWYLKANTLSLDTGLDTGVAGKSVLYFKNIPILATPSLTFPLSGARHSGFLPPTVGTTSKGGVEFALPYYWNIAPNRDLTLYPKMISRRGIQLGAEARYMGETFPGGIYKGETTVEDLPSDRLTHTNRYAVTSVHEQDLMPGLRLAWNINVASDDDYPADFSTSIAKTAQRLLSRETSLIYYGSFWNLGLRATNYQVLQDTTAAVPIGRPYDRLPQLQFHAEKYDVLGLDFLMDSSVTRFWHPTLVRGDRFANNFQVSAPLISSGYFLTPKVSLHATNYHLVNPAPGQEQDSHRIVPTFSVDSGLIFERQTKLLGRDFTQTLEPRLFYVNTPYRDQSRLPNFDSGLADFNFAQIFSENRFVGQDRIGDANQITAALVSRYLEQDGSERLKLAMGQRFYFNTQKVRLDNTISPSRSDLLLAASGKWSDQLSGDLGFQISAGTRQSVQSNYGIRWQPEAKKVLNLSYRFQRDSLEQVDISGQWPVAERWYAVGRGNYSLMDKRVVDGLAGFEYKADCWSLRFVAQRFAVNSTTSNTGFSIQLELSGLAKLGVGGNPLEALKRNINGYQSNSDR